ncbi:hypothetical protein OHA21_09305 [Actinoplanes sp. NBC_00393]|uniref:hypothetical protein n=1 Tax=Actinoplanes sp. NBC_00393 TaxID=2975953 RepID=UPI002E1BD47E
MYARLQTTASRPETDDPDKMIRMLTEMISAHPGYAGLVLLESDDQAGTLLTLWHTREDAELASERSRAAAGRPRPVELLTDDVYEVEEQVSGPATGPAGHALVAYFDGPMSPERAALARRRGRDRISPALRQVPGLIRTWVLWHPDAVKMAIVHLTTSPGAIQDVVTAVTSVPIGEDEDAALLTGPDRVGRHRVLAFAD